MGNNSIKHVLFEPEIVGWEKGFKFAIRDAVSMRVPLAVKDHATKALALIERATQALPKVEIIVLEKPL